MTLYPMHADREPPEHEFIRLTAVAERLGISVGSLRKEAARGRLAIYRLAGKDWTTDEAIRAMFDACRTTPEVPRPTARSFEESLSREERIKRARDSALFTLDRLKQGLPPTIPSLHRRTRLRKAIVKDE